MADRSVDLNAGVLAPVGDETTLGPLLVTGELPRDLNGTLYRNGPNPFSGRFPGDDMLSWWVEASMMHGLTLADGRAVSYRNRWVRTGNYHRYHHGQAGSPSSDPLWDHNPNVNVIVHSDRLLALGEGGLPFVLTAELDTIGPTTFDGSLTNSAGPTGMTAHPKRDPYTDELFVFRSDWQTPYLWYGALNGDAELILDQVIDIPQPVMMHDFAITESKMLFLDLNVGYDFSMLEHGAAIPLRWHEDKAARIGIGPRSGGPVEWYEIEPCFIQHVVNAWDLGPETVVLDAIRYPSFLRFNPDQAAYLPNPLGTLWRYTIRRSPGTGSAIVREEALDDRHIELPRIDERFAGRDHRFTYAVEQPTDSEMRGIIKYDSVTGTSERLSIPAGDQNSEPVFVPRPSSSFTQGDDGWLLVCVYRRQTDTTDVLVLEAGDLAAGPVATVHLPRRIPAGFHGTWRSEVNASTAIHLEGGP